MSWKNNLECHKFLTGALFLFGIYFIKTQFKCLPYLASVLKIWIFFSSDKIREREGEREKGREREKVRGRERRLCVVRLCLRNQFHGQQNCKITSQEKKPRNMKQWSSFSLPLSLSLSLTLTLSLLTFPLSSFHWSQV